MKGETTEHKLKQKITGALGVRLEVLTGGWEIFLFGGVFIRFGKKKKKKKEKTSV